MCVCVCVFCTLHHIVAAKCKVRVHIKNEVVVCGSCVFSLPIVSSYVPVHLFHMNTKRTHTYVCIYVYIFFYNNYTHMNHIAITWNTILPNAHASDMFKRVLCVYFYLRFLPLDIWGYVSREYVCRQNVYLPSITCNMLFYSGGCCVVRDMFYIWFD